MLFYLIDVKRMKQMSKYSDYYKWELLVIYVKLPELLFG
jgi:hypothetical protein